MAAYRVYHPMLMNIQASCCGLQTDRCLSRPKWPTCCMLLAGPKVWSHVPQLLIHREWAALDQLPDLAAVLKLEHKE